jgi:hypothetical protein
MVILAWPSMRVTVGIVIVCGAFFAAVGMQFLRTQGKGDIVLATAGNAPALEA